MKKECKTVYIYSFNSLLNGYLIPMCRFDAKVYTFQAYGFRGTSLNIKTRNRCFIAKNAPQNDIILLSTDQYSDK
jgi:hypothetical protein